MTEDKKPTEEHDEKQEKKFNVEDLENRDAPKIAGGGPGDKPLERGGGKPSKL